MKSMICLLSVDDKSLDRAIFDLVNKILKFAL